MLPNQKPRYFDDDKTFLEDEYIPIIHRKRLENFKNDKEKKKMKD